MSMLEAITLMQSGEWLHSQLLKAPHVRRSVEVPSIEPAKDGFVGISMVTGQQWLDFAAMVDCPEFTEVPQLRFQIGRWDYRDWIRERIDPWMRERTVDEIVELGQLFRLPLAALGNGATIPEMDHLQQRGVYVREPGRVPAAASTVADVGRRAVTDSHRTRDRRFGCRIPLGAKAVHIRCTVRRAPARRAAGRRFHRFLGGSVGDALAGGVRRRSDQDRVDSAARRNPLLGRDAQGRRRLVGVRLGLPRHEHQQAVGHTGSADRRRHSA